MPREIVGGETAAYNTHVGWSRERASVQVGVVSADGRPLVERLADGGSDPAEFTGVWSDLDRAGCNRLIRTLRTARDQAFGADA